MIWGKKKEESKDMWDLTVEEGLRKYGSAQKLLDAMALDPGFETARGIDPFATVMFLAYREKLLKSKKRKK